MVEKDTIPEEIRNALEQRDVTLEETESGKSVNIKVPIQGKMINLLQYHYNLNIKNISGPCIDINSRWFKHIPDEEITQKFTRKIKEYAHKYGTGDRKIAVGENPEAWEGVVDAINIVFKEYDIPEIDYSYSGGKTFRIEKTKSSGKIHNLLEKFNQIILYGPPGTGKTWTAKDVAAQMLGVGDEERDNELESCRFPESNNAGSWQIVQFHPSYNYEDFVRGITVETQDGDVTYETKDKLFSEICQAAGEDDGKKYILIIDEINRANLASVFGELIYALEYRGESVRMPYKTEGNDALIIPDNVYIIGTMNTADRSIGHIDYALRRRFVFIQCPAQRDALEKYYAQHGHPCRDRALELFQEMEKLFAGREVVSPDFSVDDIIPGHTYFMANDEKQLTAKMRFQVIPLLKEYFNDGVMEKDISEDFEGIID